MDSLRGWPSASDAAPDEAIEAPPAIGVDERRMQVRAYNLWASLLGDRSYPAVEDLDLENLGDFGPNSVLLDFTAGIDNSAIVYLGDKLAVDIGAADGVQYIDDVPARSVLSRLTDHYLQIIANRAPIGFEAEFDNDRGVTIMYRGILLPFSSDDDSIDFILGAINWKEVAPADEALAIEHEIEHTLRPAANVAPTAAVPAWADGPDSGHIDDEDNGDAAPVDAPVGWADEPRPAMPPRALPDTDAADGDAVPPAETPGADATLADWLAAARASADAAARTDSRSRAALYQAIGQAWDFALAARGDPAGLAEMLSDAGIKSQPRAPFTPIAKLVFGSGHDKTRIAEIVCVLGFAERTALGPGTLTDRLAAIEGGLKGLVKAERALRRGAGTARPAKRSTSVVADAARAVLRTAPPSAILSNMAGDGEFILLVARRLDGDHVGVVAQIDPGAALFDRLLADGQTGG